MPPDRESAVFLHPTCARDVRAIIALERRTGMVAVVRPGDTAPRLERLRRGPAGVEDRAGLMFLPLPGWPDDNPMYRAPHDDGH